MRLQSRGQFSERCHHVKACLGREDRMPHWVWTELAIRCTLLCQERSVVQYKDPSTGLLNCFHDVTTIFPRAGTEEKPRGK